MEIVRLSEETIELFIAKLKCGWTWNNGLVGNESWRYDDDRFVSEFMDMREPDCGPYKHFYTEDELRTHFRSMMLPDFVHRSLVRKLTERPLEAEE